MKKGDFISEQPAKGLQFEMFQLARIGKSTGMLNKVHNTLIK